MAAIHSLVNRASAAYGGVNRPFREAFPNYYAEIEGLIQAQVGVGDRPLLAQMDRQFERFWLLLLGVAALSLLVGSGGLAVAVAGGETLYPGWMAWLTPAGLFLLVMGVTAHYQARCGLLPCPWRWVARRAEWITRGPPGTPGTFDRRELGMICCNRGVVMWLWYV